MKSKFKFLSLLLSVLIVLSIFSACGKSSGNESNSSTDKSTVKQSSEKADEGSDARADSALPIVDKPLTLKMWYAINPAIQKLMTSLSENTMFKELEKRTGITMEFIHPPLGQEAEQFNLLIASGDLPDIIVHESVQYPGGPDKAIEDGIYIRLNELVDKYAPNFNKARNSTDEFRKQTSTDGGNLWGFPMIETKVQGAWLGLVLRQDWLDELGINTPETFDDWYVMLKAFKDKKGAKAPFLLSANGLNPDESLIAGFGVGQRFFQVDGLVKYGPIENGYKEYLTTMNKWYSEGLIDDNFATRDSESMTQLRITDGAGAWMDGFWTFKSYASQAKDKDYRVVAVPTPVKNPGDKAHLRQTNFNVRGYWAAITKDCKYPVEAVKWFDYLYSDDGYILANYGIEGETFNVVDGKYVYTDIISNNPDGLTVNEAIHKYVLHHGPMIRDWQRDLYTYTEDERNAESIWGKADSDYVMPMITATPEEGTKMASIMSDIDTYVSEMTLKFILGSEPMSRYEEFVNRIKQMNIDEAIKIQQATLDRYNSRK